MNKSILSKYPQSEKRLSRIIVCVSLLVIADLAIRDLFPELLETPYFFWPHSMVLSVLMGFGLSQGAKLYLLKAEKERFTFQTLWHDKSLYVFVLLLFYCVYSAVPVLGVGGINLSAHITSDNYTNREIATVELYGWQEGTVEKVRRRMAGHIYSDYGIKVPYLKDDGRRLYPEYTEQRRSHFKDQVEIEKNKEENRSFTEKVNFNSTKAHMSSQIMLCATLFLSLLFCRRNLNRSTFTAHRRFWHSLFVSAIAVWTVYFKGDALNWSHWLAVFLLVVCLPACLVYLVLANLRGRVKFTHILSLLIVVLSLHLFTAAAYKQTMRAEYRDMSAQHYTFDIVRNSFKNLLDGGTEFSRKTGAQALYQQFGVKVDYRLNDGSYTTFRPDKNDVKQYHLIVKQHLTIAHRKSQAYKKYRQHAFLFMTYFAGFALMFGFWLVVAKKYWFRQVFDGR